MLFSLTLALSPFFRPPLAPTAMHATCVRTYLCASQVSKSFLFVSGQDAARQQGLVASKGITHIINCAGPQCPNYLEYVSTNANLHVKPLGHLLESQANGWRKYTFVSPFVENDSFKSTHGCVLRRVFRVEQTGRFNFLRLNFYDHRTEDCSWFMYRAFDFIKAAEEQRGRVLVHCVQGVSR